MVLGNLLWVFLFKEGGWTVWLPEVPSNLKPSVSLWSLRDPDLASIQLTSCSWCAVQLPQATTTQFLLCLNYLEREQRRGIHLMEARQRLSWHVFLLQHIGKSNLADYWNRKGGRGGRGQGRRPPQTPVTHFSNISWYEMHIPRKGLCRTPKPAQTGRN